MTTTPDEPIENPPRPDQDPDINPEPQPPGGGEPVPPDVEPDPGPIKPSSDGPVNAPPGLTAPPATAATDDPTPEQPRGEPHADEDAQLTSGDEFADAGYDERQPDGTRAAAAERGAFGDRP
jgi:protein TonB